MKQAIKISIGIAAAFVLYCAGAFGYGVAKYYFGGARDRDLTINSRPAQGK